MSVWCLASARQGQAAIQKVIFTDDVIFQVMRSYLTQIFDAVNLSAGGKSSKKLGPIKMPASVTHAVSRVRFQVIRLVLNYTKSLTV